MPRLASDLPSNSWPATTISTLLLPRATMRPPLLSFVLVLAVAAATAPLVPAAEHGGSTKPLSVDGYGPLEKAAEKPKEQTTLNVEQATPAMTADTYDQKPIEEQAEKAAASSAAEVPDQYVQSLVPDDKVKEDAAAAEVKKGKSDESDESSAYPKKAKKVKKEKKEKSDDESAAKKEKEEKSDYLDESTSSKKEKKKKKSDESDKKEKSEDSDIDASSSSKKKKKVKSDDASDEDDASLLHKKKKEKKEKSTDSSDKYESGKKEKKDKSDESDDSTPSPKKEKKKEKKEKSIDSDASAYLNKEEKKSSDSDEATLVIKKQKKDKKKKEKSGGEENPNEDAAPVDVAPDGEYVSPKKEKSGEVAMPVDASSSTTTTDQYVPASSKSAGGKPWPRGGERQISFPTTTVDPFASSKHQVKSSSVSQPMAAGSPDELPPPATAAKKSSATADAYSGSEPEPMAGGSPDELPPQATTTTKIIGVTPPDPYASPAANNNNPPPAAKQQLPSMEAISGMIRRPIAKFLTPVIKSVCAKTEYPDDCESSIGGLPGAASAAATDSVGVLKLAMEVVREKVVEAASAARERMGAPGTDPTTKAALGACTSSYGDIKTALDSVADALRRGDVDTAHTNLDSVETDITTCDDGFQDRGTPSVMTDHDQELQRLASNLLSIGAAIHH